MESEVVVFMSILVAVSVLLLAWILHRNKCERDRQETIRCAIEKGQTLDKDILANLGAGNRPSPYRDLRIGLPFIGIGLAFVFLAAFGIHEPAMAWIGGFPILFGLSWVAMWFIARGK